MKQWRMVVIVMGLIVLLLIANFSIQIKKRSRRKDAQVSSTISAVVDLNSTSRPKVTKNNKTSSVEDARMDVNSKCWKTEETRILGECIHCGDFEKQKIDGCLETGNMQQMLCTTSSIKFYKSCPYVVQWEEKKFWMFEGMMLIGLIFSSFVVWYRQRQLDNIFYKKLQKQVESDTV